MDELFFGTSEAARALSNWAAEAANSDSSVLITGAAGTGKSSLARAIHDLSSRRNGPFVVIDCAKTPDATFPVGDREDAGDREADRQILRGAHGGTLVLEDIDSLYASSQVRLKKFIGRVAEPQRGDEPIDVRVIATTRRDLQEMSKEGRFDANLLWPAVIEIHIPALSERRPDVIPLLQLFLPDSKFSAEAITALTRHPWTGNIRELRELASLLATQEPFQGRFTRHYLPAKFGGQGQWVSDAPRSDFEIAFSEEFSPAEIKNLLTALSDYYRACGGVGFEVTFEAEEVRVEEPVGG